MGRSQEDLVTDQFGPRAAAYVASSVHATGPDLVNVSKLAAERRPGHVLDLGCGGGHATYAVAPHAGHVVACDLSEDMLKAVSAEAERRGLTNVEVQQAAAEQLPFADGSFDVLISRYSAHHWSDWQRGLREARRVMRPEGMLVFIDVVAPPNSLLDTHLQTIELLRDPSHVRDYSLGEWTMALEAADMALTSIATHRLHLDFADWVARMSTPATLVEAIRTLQRGASTLVRDAFQIAADGSFVIDVAMIIASPFPRAGTRQP